MAWAGIIGSRAKPLSASASPVGGVDLPRQFSILAFFSLQTLCCPLPAQPHFETASIGPLRRLVDYCGGDN